MPLMHYTLSAEHIRKLANIKNIIQSVVKEHLGINEEIPFTSMSKVEKEEVGSRLSALLKDISCGALVPLLDSALSSEEVRKLASLKNIGVDEISNVLTDNTVKKELKEEDKDDDELMAAAITDIPQWLKNQEETRRNKCNSEAYTSSNSVETSTRYQSWNTEIPARPKTPRPPSWKKFMEKFEKNPKCLICNYAVKRPMSLEVKRKVVMEHLYSSHFQFYFQIEYITPKIACPLCAMHFEIEDDCRKHWAVHHERIMEIYFMRLYDAEWDPTKEREVKRYLPIPKWMRGTTAVSSTVL